MAGSMKGVRLRRFAHEASAENLLIPPPPQQRTMHYPCLGTNVGNCSEKGLYECGKVRKSLIFAERLSRKATVIMWMESRLVEVFVVWVAHSSTTIPVQMRPHIPEVRIPLLQRFALSAKL